MIRILTVIAVMVTPLTASAFDVLCSFGATCIETQGTRIPSDKVIEMSGACDDFIRNDIGVLALKLSHQEIHNRTNGKPMHPLNVAVWAFEQLRNSPLRFERKSDMEETNYYTVKKACFELNRDFYDSAKRN